MMILHKKTGFAMLLIKYIWMHLYSAFNGIKQRFRLTVVFTIFILAFINTPALAQSNALIFVENLDKFPSNEHFTFARIQLPWSRDGVNFNANHDSLKARIYNKGIGSLVISNLILSNTTAWKIDKLNGVTYVPGSALPITITSGNFVDLIIKFIAKDAGTRVVILHGTLTIVSNDGKNPSKKIFLDGLWQKMGEGSREPWVQ